MVVRVEQREESVIEDVSGGEALANAGKHFQRKAYVPDADRVAVLVQHRFVVGHVRFVENVDDAAKHLALANRGDRFAIGIE